MPTDSVCPACCNLRIRMRPITTGDSDEFILQWYACPVCCTRAYPNGFGGERQGDEWIIDPYSPGGTPVYHGLKTGIPREGPGV